MKSKKVLIKFLMIVGVIICINLWAENESNYISEEENSFWTNSNIPLAYMPYEYDYIGNYTCMPTRILDAKLWMLEYWFYPSPEENRFQRYLLEKEIKILNAETKLRKKNKQIITTGVITMISGSLLGIVLGVKIKNLAQ